MLIDLLIGIIILLKLYLMKVWNILNENMIQQKPEQKP